MMDEIRRYAAEILIGWAMRLYPMRTETDFAVLRALLVAVKTAMISALPSERTAPGDATAKPSKTGSTR